MSWIKLRTKLKDDGRILIAARKCNASTVTVFGALVTLWCYADEHADENGVLVGWKSEDINARVGIENFAEALPTDWIDLNGEWVQLPNYAEHNGSTAKTRACAQKRQNASRSRHASTVTREEKRREDKRRDKKENIKEKSLPAVACPLWEGCEFFRMSQDDFQKVIIWFSKNDLPENLITPAIAEVDRWLGTDSPKAIQARKKTESHHRHLYASWVLENAQRFQKASGHSKPRTNVDVALSEMKKYSLGFS